MKQPLHSLTVALAAVVPAAVLTSCNSDEEVRAKTAPQRHAFAAAAGLPQPGEEPVSTSTPATEAWQDARAAAAANFAEATRIKAAQRNFWIRYLRSHSDKFPGAAELIKDYETLHVRWVESLIAHRYDGEVSETGGHSNHLAENRQNLDRFCADLTRLSTDARKEWDERQSENWQGWPDDRDDPYLLFIEQIRILVGPGSANFRTRSYARARPLLDEFEFLDDFSIGHFGWMITPPDVVVDHDNISEGESKAVAERAALYNQLELIYKEYKMLRDDRELNIQVDGFILENPAVAGTTGE